MGCGVQGLGFRVWGIGRPRFSGAGRDLPS